jgi:hypothetical protein
MMLQLSYLEREGCIRLDQVWNTPNYTEMDQAYLAASDQMADLLTTPNEQFQSRAHVISQELGQALKDMAKGETPKVKAQTRRERSPSKEMVDSGARAAGKGQEESRQQKRAREEKGAVQQTAKRTLEPPKPEYLLVSPEEWEKQKEGTYRYDHKKWCEDGKDPWSIRGNKIGGLRAGGTLWLRIPSVVQPCRKVSGKSRGKSAAGRMRSTSPSRRTVKRGPSSTSTAWPSWRPSATPSATWPCSCPRPTSRVSTSSRSGTTTPSPG